MKLSIKQTRRVKIEYVVLVWLVVLTQFVDAMTIQVSSNPNPSQSLMQTLTTNSEWSQFVQDTSFLPFTQMQNSSLNNDITHQFYKSRLLLECKIDNCLYCIITSFNQFCIVCQYPYQPDSLLTHCSEFNTNSGSPVTPNCTITNCNTCQTMTLGIMKQQICVQCATGYRFLILQGKCYPKNQLNDSSEITSYDTYYYLCQQGCKSCQPSTTIELCYICMDGYTMIQNASSCIKCKEFCRTCQYIDTSFCLTCYLGFALNSNNTCVRCGTEHCEICDPVNYNTCYSCITGYFLHNNQCFSCQSSCQNCANSTTQCSLCQSGSYYYSLTSSQNTFSSKSYQCLSCIYGCMNCYNINSCNECFPGYFLKDNRCEACQENCWQCTSATDCKTCLIGYDLFNNNCIVEKENCILMNEDGTCKFCKSEYEEIQGDCVLNQNDSSIVTMACKYGMFAQSYWCYYCNDTFPNCYQCNSAYCLKCHDRYYLQTSNYTCKICTIRGCSVCQSQEVCLECFDGYYLQQFTRNGTTSSNGVCLSCDSNCRKCRLNSKYCTECSDGYILSKQRVCETSNNFYINMKLDFDYLTHPQIVDAIRSSLLDFTNHSNSSQQSRSNIKLLSITSGSTIIYAEVYEETSDSLQTSLQTLTSNLINGSSIGGVILLSVSFSKPIAPSTSSVNKLPIILGTVLGFLAIVLLVIIICCFCRKKIKQNHDKNEKKPSSQGQTVDENEEQNNTNQKIIKKQLHQQQQQKQFKKDQDNKQSKTEDKIMGSNVKPDEGKQLQGSSNKFNPYIYI